MTRILAVGHAVGPTGYGRVLGILLAGLHARGHEVHHFTVNRPSPSDRPWATHPNRLPGDPYGLRASPALADRVRPDIVIVLHDPWIAARHAAALRDRRARPAVIVYCPLDGPIARPELLSGLRAADLLVACTRFGRAQLRPFTGHSALPVIPHPVDATSFHPVPAASQSLFPDRPELHDAFIVLNANRHNLRKRLDLTLDGFARFARGKPPTVKLYLHAPIEPRTLPDPQTYLSLRAAGRLLHTRDDASREFPELAAQDLNLIYNACQVGLNTATAEGFGLIPFEHAATGAPQILPAHPTCTELWPHAATFLPLGPPTTYPGDPVAHRATTTAAVADALEALYATPHLATAAQRNAARAEFRPPAFVDAWHRLLEAGVPPRPR